MFCQSAAVNDTRKGVNALQAAGSCVLCSRSECTASSIHVTQGHYRNESVVHGPDRRVTLHQHSSRLRSFVVIYSRETSIDSFLFLTDGFLLSKYVKQRNDWHVWIV